MSSSHLFGDLGLAVDGAKFVQQIRVTGKNVWQEPRQEARQVAGRAEFGRKKPKSATKFKNNSSIVIMYSSTSHLFHEISLTEPQVNVFDACITGGCWLQTLDKLLTVFGELSYTLA